VDGRQVARTKADGTVGYTVSDLRAGTDMLIVTAPVPPEPLRLWGRPSGTSLRDGFVSLDPVPIRKDLAPGEEDGDK
jgi:hypothetical protein